MGGIIDKYLNSSLSLDSSNLFPVDSALKTQVPTNNTYSFFVNSLFLFNSVKHQYLNVHLVIDECMQKFESKIFKKFSVLIF